MSCDNCGHIGDTVRIVIIKNKWPNRTHIIKKFCCFSCLYEFIQGGKET